MKALTLFSGIGGFDLALERAGVEVVGVCEIDNNAQGILRRHFPSAELYDDVKNIGANTHARGSIDIICGGFPCQDLSIAGKRKGLDGERSGLWYEFARIIDELEPQWVVIENVPGLLSSAKGSDFAVILQWLAERGYCVAWRVLDAQYFGVAQRRRRVFVVASFGNGRAAEILFEPESLSGNTPPSRETGQGIAETFTIRSGSEGGGKGYLGAASLAMTLGGQPQYLSHAVMASGENVTGTLDASGDQEAFRGTHHVLDDQGGSQMSISKDVVPTLRASVHGHQPLIANWTSGGGKMDDEIAATLRAGAEHNSQFVWEMQHASEAYRETQGGIAPTLQSRMGTGGNNVPLVGIRRLTPLECERLQGFPDGWTDGQSDSARYKQLGNAVAVPVVEWICKRIAEALV